MEAVAAEIADRSEILSVVCAHHALCGIFHNHQAVAAGNIHNRIHFAGNARIMNDDDCFCLFGDRLFDLRFVDVHRIGSDIDEHQPRAGKHRRIRRA